MIGHLRDEIENSRKTSFSDLFSDGKPAEISRDFEPTTPFILFTCVVLYKPRFGAGQQICCDTCHSLLSLHSCFIIDIYVL